MDTFQQHLMNNNSSSGSRTAATTTATAMTLGTGSGTTNTRSRFYDKDFNVEEYINTSSPFSTENNFDANALLVHFEHEIERLWQEHDNVKSAVNQLEMTCSAAEDQHLQTFEEAGTDIEGALEALQTLGQGISQISVKVVHVGDQLEGTKARRDRAIDASVIVRHFDAFCDAEKRLLPPFNDVETRPDLEGDDGSVDRLTNEQIEEAVSIMQKVKYLSTELSSSHNHNYSAAQSRISRVNKELEEYCISKFRKALVLDKMDTMKQMSRFLHALSPKVHTRLVDVLVSHMVSRLPVHEETIFDACVQLCGQIKELVVEVFDQPMPIMLILVNFLLKGCVADYVRKELSESSDRLESLYKLYLRVDGTVSRLNEDIELNLDVNDRARLILAVFQKDIQDYIDHEIASLQEVYSYHLRDFYVSINQNPDALVGATSKLSLLNKMAQHHPQPESDIEDIIPLLIDNTLSATLIHENERALRRCKALSPPKKAAEWCFRIFVQLLEGLCEEYLRTAVKIASKALPPKKPKSEPSLVFLTLIGSCNSNVFLVQKHFQDVVAPLIAGDDTVRTSCIKRKNEVLLRLEGDLTGGLTRCAEAAIEWSRHILSQKQDKADYRLPEDSLTMLKCTQACEAVTSFLLGVIATVHRTLNGKNRTKFYHFLGCAIHSVLLSHITQYSISILGAVVLKRDLAAYSECLQRLEDPFVNELMATFIELSQVLSVPHESLSQLCSEGRLANIKKATIHTFLHLRADYKSSKLGALKL